MHCQPAVCRESAASRNPRIECKNPGPRPVFCNNQGAHNLPDCTLRNYEATSANTETDGGWRICSMKQSGKARLSAAEAHLRILCREEPERIVQQLLPVATAVVTPTRTVPLIYPPPMPQDTWAITGSASKKHAPFAAAVLRSRIQGNPWFAQSCARTLSHLCVMHFVHIQLSSQTPVMGYYFHNQRGGPASLIHELSHQE